MTAVVQGEIFAIIPPGEYIVRVKKADDRVSKGDKTRGADTIELTLVVETTGSVIYESLLFHEKTAWRVTNALIALNFQVGGKLIVENQKFKVEGRDLLGLRGWAIIETDVYKEKKRNRIAVWPTDKPKLDRMIIEGDDIPFA
jgi:hypothetical protein